MSVQILEVSLSGRSRNGAPSRKGCVVDSPKTKVSNKNEYPPPPSPSFFATKLLAGVRTPGCPQSPFFFTPGNALFCLVYVDTAEVALGCVVT